MKNNLLRRLTATVLGALLAVTSGNFKIESFAKTNAEDSHVLWGDANCDNVVDTADTVLVMQSIAHPNKYAFGEEFGITEQGLINADVYENGSGITNMDALSILEYKLGVITQLPESFLTTTTTTTTTSTMTTTTTTTATTTKKPTTTTTTTATTTKKPTTTTTTTVTTTKKPTTTTTTMVTTTTKKPTTTTTTTTITTTTTTTTTITTTTTTTIDRYTFETGLAKDYQGNDITYYEVKFIKDEYTEWDDDGNEYIEYVEAYWMPERDAMFEHEGKTFDYNQVFGIRPDDERLSKLLELPEKLGFDNYKIVVSTEPIMYSWLWFDGELEHLKSTHMQICSLKNFENKNIYGDGYLVDTNSQEGVLWCPGKWVDYAPEAVKGEEPEPQMYDESGNLVEHLLLGVSIDIKACLKTRLSSEGYISIIPLDDEGNDILNIQYEDIISIP